MLTRKEEKRRSIASAVMRQAWAYHRHTILFKVTLATSLKIAWQTIRSFIRIHHSKVVGVKRRQGVLWRLSQYQQEDIILYFQRQWNDPYDPNAIQIIVAVKGRGKAVLGYLRRELAAIIAPKLDAGKEALVMLDRITGAGSKGLLGCNFSYVII